MLAWAARACCKDAKEREHGQDQDLSELRA